jgi:hypothetical protein
MTCRRVASAHSAPLFMVSDIDATAIRTVYRQEGELSVAIELRRRFPGITDDENAPISLSIRARLRSG